MRARACAAATRGASWANSNAPSRVRASALRARTRPAPDCMLPARRLHQIAGAGSHQRQDVQQPRLLVRARCCPSTRACRVLRRLAATQRLGRIEKRWRTTQRCVVCCAAALLRCCRAVTVVLLAWPTQCRGAAQVIELDPRNSHAYHNRGISYDKLGEFEKAISDFTTGAGCSSRALRTAHCPHPRFVAAVLELDATNAHAYFSRGSTHDSMGAYDQVRRVRARLHTQKACPLYIRRRATWPRPGAPRLLARAGSGPRRGHARRHARRAGPALVLHHARAARVCAGAGAARGNLELQQ